MFTARVLAAAPRVVTIPDRVYLWHVRRSAARQSISLDRKDVANWQARIAAHRASVQIFQDAGHKALAHAAATKFLDHDLRMYVRELHTRGADYRTEWWRLTRDYLAGFDEADLRAARAPAPLAGPGGAGLAGPAGPGAADAAGGPARPAAAAVRGGRRPRGVVRGPARRSNWTRSAPSRCTACR